MTTPGSPGSRLWDDSTGGDIWPWSGAVVRSTRFVLVGVTGSLVARRAVRAASVSRESTQTTPEGPHPMSLTSGSDRESRRSGDRLSPWLPWTDDSGRPWRGWIHLPLAAPFVCLYLLVSWTLFLLTAERENATYYKIETDDLRDYLFRIPKLSEDFLGALRDLLTAPILNHDSTQLIYVTVLLLLFGIVFEVKEGTWTTTAV